MISWNHNFELPKHNNYCFENLHSMANWIGTLRGSFNESELIRHDKIILELEHLELSEINRNKRVSLK